MIVVVGSPVARSGDARTAAAGLGADIARRAAASGAAVELVGRVGEDAAGDEVLLALAADGVGHVATLREPGRPTPTAPPSTGSVAPDSPDLGDALLAELDDEGAASPDAEAAADATAGTAGLSVDAGDLELALRYLPDYRVLVVADDLDPAVLATVAAAASWSGAMLVVVQSAAAASGSLPDDATVLARPARDPDGAFAAMVAAYVVALDQGAEPRAAFAGAQRTGGWAAVAD